MNNITDTCWDVKKKDCLTYKKWDSKYASARLITGGAFYDISNDTTAGSLSLLLSLVLLCISLYTIVKLLHGLVIKSQGQGILIRYIKHTLSVSPYLTMVYGTILTIAVQSSSITTSTFTPLVGLGIITVEQMYPLSLGCNIGTTFTAMLAALATSKKNAIQIAMCHLLFNILGILIWFPVPRMRNVPIRMANKLGEHIEQFKCFGVFYIAYSFIVVPLMLYGTSHLFDLGTGALFMGILMTMMIVYGSFLVFAKFDKLTVCHKLLRCSRGGAEIQP